MASVVTAVLELHQLLPLLAILLMAGAKGLRVDAGLCFEKLVLIFSGCVVVPGKVGKFLIEVGGGLEVFNGRRFFKLSSEFRNFHRCDFSRVPGYDELLFPLIDGLVDFDFSDFRGSTLGRQ